MDIAHTRSSGTCHLEGRHITHPLYYFRWLGGLFVLPSLTKAQKHKNKETKQVDNDDSISESFLTYLKIGLFGFGGGYAMLSLIQHEAVEVVHWGEESPWISPTEFTDIVAISQMTPGPIGINSATYIGYTVTGNIWGSVIATFAVCLPSFLLVLMVSRFILKHKDHPIIKSIFAGLRPVVVGLIGAAALLLMNRENFTDNTFSIAIAAIAFALTYFTKVHPIMIIVLAGIAGYIIY